MVPTICGSVKLVFTKVDKDINLIYRLAKAWEIVVLRLLVDAPI